MLEGSSAFGESEKKILFLIGGYPFIMESETQKSKAQACGKHFP